MIVVIDGLYGSMEGSMEGSMGGGCMHGCMGAWKHSMAFVDTHFAFDFYGYIFFTHRKFPAPNKSSFFNLINDQTYCITDIYPYAALFLIICDLIITIRLANEERTMCRSSLSSKFKIDLFKA